ncbi:MAG: tetratricopeptide repeat protein [Balneolaceae bacterium]
MVERSSNKNQPKAPLSSKKKVLFYTITFSIPILFFLIIELVLRGTNYLGNTDLFVDPNIPSAEYLIPNPNFAARYFFYTKTIPNPSIDAFLKNKPENGYRVFAMGGSSAAGYPYGFNGTYSRVVQDVLQDAMPDREVEVINVSISAISSYTLFDQVDEIMEHKPDAILIYAGHNEFYGALGVGSNENLGGFPGFVRFYLKLQRFKTFMLLRNIIVDSGIWFAETFSDEKIDQSATLMERIVNSRSIELGSPQYELAMAQFESNLSEIVTKFGEEEIPVFVGSVASNLKDHSPFVSIEGGDQPPAKQVYEEAIQEYENQNYAKALEKFTLAKNLDGLKFRAPSQINEIIKSTASDYDWVQYVPAEEELVKFTSDGIIGFDLMLEHLHPNQQGYFLLGKAFSESILSYNEIVPDQNLNTYKDRMFFSEFDVRVAWHRVATLKQSFPFVMGAKPELYVKSYSAISLADSLAVRTVHYNKNWDESKVELAQAYQKQSRYDEAILEYRGLIRNQPWNDSPYVFAARIYLEQNDFDNAEPLLLNAFEINPNDAFITKMLGAIEVHKGNSVKGIEYLERSRKINPNDPQMLYNLSGAYGTNLQLEKALETANQVISINPNFPGIQAWKAQLQSLLNR